MDNKLTSKRVFILGAGFSRAICGIRSPLNKDLYNVLSKLFTDITKTIQERMDEKNIETFLTYLDLEISNTVNAERKNALINEREIIRQEIIKIFNNNLPNLNEYSDLASVFVEKLRKDDTIITFNYDIFLERFLHYKKIWSPHGGYTERMKYDETNNNIDIKNIEIIKLHGSVNFKQGLTYGSKKYQYLALEVTTNHFPENHEDLGILEDNGPYIILPTYIKTLEFREIAILWQEAFERISSAEEIIIIGYSFPEPDILSRCLLNHIKYDRGAKTERKIIIIDPESDRITKIVENSILINPKQIKWDNKPGELKDRVEVLSILD